MRSGIRKVGEWPAGWRVLLFVLLVGVAVVGLEWLLAALFPHPHATQAALWSAAGEATALLAVVLTTWLMSWLEGRAFGHFGLPVRGAFGAWFWRGVAWGAIALTVLLLLMRASGSFHFGGVEDNAQTILRHGGGWALAFLAVGLTEEFAFRGYALVTLAGSKGFWRAAVLLSLLFGGVHLSNGGESWVGALAAALIGLFFCFTFRRTGSLWFAVGLHAAWDFCESFVYGVPDSGAVTPGRLLHPSFSGSRWLTGGSVGPEGSLWVFLVIALLFVVFARWHPAAAAPAGDGS